MHLRKPRLGPGLGLTGLVDGCVEKEAIRTHAHNTTKMDRGRATDNDALPRCMPDRRVKTNTLVQ